MLIRSQDKKENKHTENFSSNTETKEKKGLGKLSRYQFSRTQSRINQNVTKFYSPKIIKLYSDLIR